MAERARPTTGLAVRRAVVAAVEQPARLVERPRRVDAHVVRQPAQHRGLAAPGGVRNHLSASFSGPCFSHFATDISGTRLVTDTTAEDRGGRVFAAALGRVGEDPASSWRCLAHPRSSWKKEAHIHPFLSPDGTRAFFNSDESGLLQAYMIQGLEAVG